MGLRIGIKGKSLEKDNNKRLAACAWDRPVLSQTPKRTSKPSAERRRSTKTEILSLISDIIIRVYPSSSPAETNSNPQKQQLFEFQMEFHHTGSYPIWWAKAQIKASSWHIKATRRCQWMATTEELKLCKGFCPPPFSIKSVLLCHIALYYPPITTLWPPRRGTNLVTCQYLVAAVGVIIFKRAHPPTITIQWLAWWIMN